MMFKRVDIFGTPVALNFNGTDKSRSFTGAAFTLIVCGFVIWSIYQVGIDIVLRKSPKTIMSEAFSEDPGEMIISPNTFNFAFGLQDPDNFFHYIDDSIYTVEVLHSQLKRSLNPDGTANLTWTDTPLEVETCRTDHFGTLGPKFADLELNKLFCLKKEQPALDKLRIQGVFESPIYEYIQANIKKCVDDDPMNLHCADNNTINKALSGFFAVYYNNMAFNPKNYTNPDIEYRDSSYSSVVYPNFKELTLWLNHVEVASDIGWLTEDNKHLKFIQFDKLVENIIFRENPDKVFSMVVRVSKVTTQYERSYTKIQDIFADINGLAAAAIVACAFFLRPYSNIKFYEGLINELFDIKDLNDGQPRSPKSPKRKEFERKQTKKQSVKLNKQPSSPRRQREPTFLKINLNQSQADLNLRPSSPNDLLSMSNFPLNPSERKGHEPLESIDPTSNRDPAHKFTFQEKRAENSQPISHKPSLIKTNHNKVSEIELEIKGKDQDLQSGITLKSRDNSIAYDHTVEGGLDSKYDNFISIGGMASRISTYKSRLLITRPANVKPQHKILENYEAKSLGELDIVLESLILDKEEKRKEQNLHTLDDRRKLSGADYENPDNKKAGIEDSIDKSENNNKEFERKLNEIEDIDERTMDEEEIITRAKVLPAKLQKDSDKIHITFWDYVRSYVWRSKSMKEKMRLLREGVRRIEERLDIFNVLKKLREVDKLKLLLLESEQLVLFDTLPRPELSPIDIPENTIDIKKSSKAKLRESKFITDKRRNDLITKSYENLKRKNSKTMIDERLLDVFDDIIES